MNNEKIIRETEVFVKENVPESRPADSYIRHVFGTRNYARHLAEIYHADIFVVVTAALLHDIASDVVDMHA
ncbi:Uncharacterised protein [uncultured archaeon]|nr:Uncharacterised protein [uncultured archaeon]